MDNSEPKDLEDLKNLREHYRTWAFRLVLGILFIFGVPAAVAVWLGRMLDIGEGRQWQLIFLVVAFILSWSALIIVWRKIDKGLRETDAKIKAAIDKRKEDGLLKPM